MEDQKINKLIKKLKIVSFFALVASGTISTFLYLEIIMAGSVSWNFSNNSDYSYDSNKIDVASNYASLKAIDQTDDNNSSSGFGGGSHNNTFWNSSSNSLEIDRFGNIEELPDSGGMAAWVDMTQNVFLAHLNNETASNNTVLLDSSGNGNNGILVTDNGTNNKISESQINSGLHLDGNGDYGDFPSLDSLIDNNFTLCSWANAEDYTDYQKIAGTLNNNNSPSSGFALYSNADGRTMRAIVNNVIVNDTSTYSLNEWNFWCISYSSSGSQIKLYRNGVVKNTGTGSYTDSGKKFGIGNIGSDASSFNASQGWQGKIDEVAVWNRTLSESEILDIYTKQSPVNEGDFISRIIDAGGTVNWSNIAWQPKRPHLKELPNNNSSEVYYSAGNANMTQNIALYHLNEVADSTIFTDSSQSSNSLTCSGITCPIAESEGLFNTSVNFDGSNDYLISSFSGTSLTTFSLEFWFKSNTGANPNGIFQWANALSSGTPFILLRGNSATSTSWYVSGGYRNTFSHPSNEWTHVALTHDGSVWRFYLNGNYTGNYTGARHYQDGANNLYLGNGFGGYYPGSIDEFAVFSRVLSDAEISDHYRRGSEKLKIQVRSCNDNSCIGEDFIGPDGTNSSYYSEELNNSENLPELNLENIDANQYFQYQALFETDTSSPQINAVSIGPDHYNAGKPAIVNISGQAYNTLESFSAITSPTSEGTVSFQISNNGIDFYYFNGSNWVVAGANDSNSESTVDQNIATFPSDVGTGNFHFKAFLISDLGTQSVDLDDIAINYDGEGSPGVLTLSNVPASITFTSISSGTDTSSAFTNWSSSNSYIEVNDTREGTGGFELQMEFSNLSGTSLGYTIESTNYFLSSSDAGSFLSSDMTGITAPLSPYTVYYDGFPLIILEGDTSSRSSGTWYVYPETTLNIPALLPQDSYTGTITFTLYSKQ